MQKDDEWSDILGSRWEGRQWKHQSDLRAPWKSSLWFRPSVHLGELLPGSLHERSCGSHHLHHACQRGIRLKWTFGVCLQMKTGANISVLILTTHMNPAFSAFSSTYGSNCSHVFAPVRVCLHDPTQEASHLVPEIIRLLFGGSAGMKRGHYGSQGSSLTTTTDPNNTSSSSSCSQTLYRRADLLL